MATAHWNERPALRNLVGGNGLTTNGAGTVALNGAGNYSTTTVNGGAVERRQRRHHGSLGTGDVLLARAPRSTSTALTTIVVSNAISGGGAVSLNGGGTVTYSGNAKTYTGATNINSGTLTNQGTINGTSTIIVGAAPGGTATLNIEAGSTTTVTGAVEVADSAAAPERST